MTENWLTSEKSKPAAVCAAAIAAAVIMGVTASISVTIVPKWYGLLLGLGLMLAAIPVHLLGKKDGRLYILSYVVNSVGSGFSVSAFYTCTGQELDAVQIAAGIFPVACVLILLAAGKYRFEDRYKAAVVIERIVCSVMIILYAVLWFLEKSVLFSFGFFTAVLSLAFLVLSEKKKKHGILGGISLSSFACFAVLTLIVAVILSEGDVLDGVVPDVDMGKKRSGKRQTFRGGQVSQ